MLKMSVKLTRDRSDLALRRYNDAARRGIDKAGSHLLTMLKRGYTNYYTSQNFRNTIFVRDNLTAAMAEKKPTGWYTMVGVPSAMVVPRGQTRVVDRGLVALAWELGHTNEFNPKGVGRKQIAVPTAIKATQKMIDIFARTVKRTMESK
jgi:hypothetical protein